MSDVGLSHRCAIIKCKSRIPLTALPTDMPAGMKHRIRSHCKPDAMPVRTERNVKRYKLLEIKYCRDTDPSQQETRAERQHDRLMKALHIFDPKAEVKTDHNYARRVRMHLQENRGKIKGTGSNRTGPAKTDETAAPPSMQACKRNMEHKTRSHSKRTHIR